MKQKYYEYNLDSFIVKVILNMNLLTSNVQTLIFNSLWNKLTNTQAFQYFIFIFMYIFRFEIIRLFFSHLINGNLSSLNYISIDILDNVIQSSVYIFILIAAIYILSLYLAGMVDYIYQFPTRNILNQNIVYILGHKVENGKLTLEEAAKLVVEKMSKSSDRGQLYLKISCVVITLISLSFIFAASLNKIVILLFFTFWIFFILLCSLRHFFNFEEQKKLEFKNFKEFVHHFLRTDFDDAYWLKYDIDFRNKAKAVYPVYSVMIWFYLVSIFLCCYIIFNTF